MPPENFKRIGWWLAFKLARRELRGGLSGFRIFLLCLVLGISTIAAVGSLSASLVAGLQAQGQQILGGDADFRLLQREAFDNEKIWLNQQGAVSMVATLRAMVRLPDDANNMLVEAKAVDAAYPFYGQVRLSPKMPLARALARQSDGSYGAVAEAGLFARLGVGVGDKLKFGNAMVTLTAKLLEEPDRTAGGFPVAPRLLVSEPNLRGTGLLRPGSLINFHYRIKLGDNASAAQLAVLAHSAGELFPNAGWRIRDRSDASPSLRRFIEQLGLFLTLVGLTALVVGGVGIGNAISAYLHQRRETIAIIKALGGSGRFIFRIYAAQIAVLTMLGVVLGLTLGAATPYLIKSFFGALLPIDLLVQFYPRPLLTAAGFGILSASAFALWPLSRVENMPVAALFRDRIETAFEPPARRYMLAIAACFAGLIGLALLISERRDIALWFLLGVAAAYLALRVVAYIIVALARWAGRPRRPELRMALGNITRPNAPVRAIVLSIGLSVTLLSAISMVDGNITRQIEGNLPTRAPSFFLLDITPAQIDEVLAVARASPGYVAHETSPMLRAQISAVNGVGAAQFVPTPDSAWALRGDRGITYANTAPLGGEIVAGQWWAADYQGAPLVSLDADIARGFGVTLGDTLRVNVLGRPITATIANLRKIDWSSGGMNYIMVFSPAPLDAAPHSYLATITLQPEVETNFARAISRQFPNVTLIRVKEAIELAAGILSDLALAIRAMSVVSLLAGILVLAGAIASGHHLRLYDAVIMKVLGATRWRIMAAFALEYAIMGLGAALISAVAGGIASWALVAGAMQTQWVFLPVTMAFTILGAVGLTVILGLIGTFVVLSAPVAPVLRSE